jgi:hypothetical protein
MIFDDAMPTVRTPVIAIERLLWVGPLTVLTSIAAVLAVRLLIVQVPGVRRDSVSMGWIAPTADTAILCTMAVFVFAGIAAFHDNPVRQYRRLAFGALLVSFLPLLIVGSGGLYGNVPTAIALAAMHIAAYVPCVTVMPKLTTLIPRATDVDDRQETIA